MDRRLSTGGLSRLGAHYAGVTGRAQCRTTSRADRINSSSSCASGTGPGGGDV